MRRGLRIVCMSDIHSRLRPPYRAPPGDVLIVAGDFTVGGYKPEYRNFVKLMAAQPHPYKLVICGNHELNANYLERLPKDFTLLHDTSVTIKGVKFYGTPYTPLTKGWAFSKSPAALVQAWQRIPTDVDVLITHIPPEGILDIGRGRAYGCPHLAKRLNSLRLLKLHVFGHVHDARGKIVLDGVQYVNASMNTGTIDLPFVIDLPPK